MRPYQPCRRPSSPQVIWMDQDSGTYRLSYGVVSHCLGRPRQKNGLPESQHCLTSRLLGVGGVLADSAE